MHVLHRIHNFSSLFTRNWCRIVFRKLEINMVILLDFYLFWTLLHLPPVRFHCVGGCSDRNPTGLLRPRRLLRSSRPHEIFQPPQQGFYIGCLRKRLLEFRESRNFIRKWSYFRDISSDFVYFRITFYTTYLYNLAWFPFEISYAFK